MDQSELHEADFLLWTEQQAAELGRLLPGSNSLDIANLAEEIETLGRSELRSVESDLRQIMVYLLKIAAQPGADAVPSWRSEILGFQANARDGATASMHGRIRMPKLWQDAVVNFADRASPRVQDAKAAALLQGPPFEVADLLSDSFDIDAAIDRVSVIAEAFSGLD